MKYIPVLVLVLLKTTSAGPWKNLALRGVADYKHHNQYVALDDASFAIDGDRTSCVNTRLTTDPWWRVDLKDTFVIKSVTITTGIGLAQAGAEIRIGDSTNNGGTDNLIMAILGDNPDSELQTFDFHEHVQGRYVFVRRPGAVQFLRLCEVEVYGYKEKYENVALSGEATQINTFSDNTVASHAIDGNSRDYYQFDHCARTLTTTNPWWRVDLRGAYTILEVSIANRGVSSERRLDGAEIRVGNSLRNNGNDNPLAVKLNSTDRFASPYITFPKPMDGRYINVYLPGTDKYLVLCEVEVYGYPLFDNVALDGDVTQVDTLGSGAASKAIDGNRDSDYEHGSCTHTETANNPWWRVDLRQTYVVTSVTITNRGDCCAERLDGAEIRVGHSLWNNGNDNVVVAKISHIPSGKTRSFPVFVEGRYVNVYQPGTDKYLTLCEVEVYGYPVYDNVALVGEAAQISTYAHGAASNAIDGNRDSIYYHNSCTHTDTTTNPWWRVKLPNPFFITAVAVTNRGDCCAERLDGAEIRVGNSLVPNGNDNTLLATISHIPLAKTRVFSFPEPVEGRFVSVFLPGTDKTLTLCEVEVYGYPPNDNVVRGGIATQSSTYGSGAASKAIDGNQDSVYDHDSCTHTETTTNPWWRVDLRLTFVVTSVVITNRGDCCAEKLDGAEIRVGDSLVNNGNDNAVVATISHIPLGKSQAFTSSGKGRYVNVYLPGKDKTLTLCEVEVYGYPANGNIALPGEATQINTYDERGAASNANNGNRDPMYSHGSCSHTLLSTNPWWRVDLLLTYVVTAVSVTNRGGCCSERLDGAEIRVGNSLVNSGNDNALVATISHISLARTRTIVFSKPVVGRYVNVYLPGTDKYLTLCEVEVYGYPAFDNVARGGIAAQISTYDDRGAASNAIDGNQDSFFTHGSCTHTLSTTDPWWRVDLRHTHVITAVVITNRGGCCAERLDGAQIRVGHSLQHNGNDNALMATILHIPLGNTQVFAFSEPVEGRYVNVYLPGTDKVLTLCEVEVYGYLANDNVAQRGTATQISTHGSGAASKAIDGNRDSDDEHGSCTHTVATNNPWWRVDLRHTHVVHTVSVTNRGDCCAERLDGAEIRVGDSLENNGNDNALATTISSIPLGDTRIIHFSAPVEGRYVNVYLPGTDKTLTLCEVEVYGYKRKW